MAELPFHIESDHLPEVRGRNGIVQVCPVLGSIERIADRLARKLDAETPVKSDESVLPMLAVAVERAAHVEKDRANHSAVSLLDERLARNRRSALRCQSHRMARARFIGTRTNTKNKSIRWNQARTPMA